VNSGQQTTVRNSGQQTEVSKAGNSGQHTANSKQRTANSGQRSAVSSQRVSIQRVSGQRCMQTSTTRRAEYQSKPQSPAATCIDHARRFNPSSMEQVTGKEEDAAVELQDKDTDTDETGLDEPTHQLGKRKNNEGSFTVRYW
jgi:hypothetical protein